MKRIMDGLHGWMILPRIPADHPIRLGNRFDWLLHAVIVMISEGDGQEQTTVLNWDRLQAELIGMGIDPRFITREKIRCAVKRLETYGVLETYVRAKATDKHLTSNQQAPNKQLTNNRQTVAKSVILNNIFKDDNQQAINKPPTSARQAPDQQPIGNQEPIKNKEKPAALELHTLSGESGLLSNPVKTENDPRQKWAHELAVIEAFEAAFPMLGKLRNPWTTERGKKALPLIAKRAKSAEWAAGDILAWVALFERLGEAHSFISLEIAAGKRWFDLPWLLKAENFEKAVAGKYDGNSGKTADEAAREKEAEDFFTRMREMGERSRAVSPRAANEDELAEVN